jgi:4-hydroxyphenylpyruvate dioxygenase
MGSILHEMPSGVICTDNPAGTDGFEFVEFAHPDAAALRSLFNRMGFALVARHRSRLIELYRQGGVNYILNADADSFGGRFAERHGPSAPSMAWRVCDADRAFDHALAHGAQPYRETSGAKTIDAPAIVGIGGSLIYFIDRYGPKGSCYPASFDWVDEEDPHPFGVGLETIDHLTNNVRRGNMDHWYRFYSDLFNFRQIRYFDIEGRKTGLHSRALTSPCGKIRIPLNESADDESQIEEFLHAYKGEGIQHIACACRNIYDTVRRLDTRGLQFMPPPPDTYYEQIEARLPGHGERVDELRTRGLLIDGASGEGMPAKLLLQIFSNNVIGPIFFEFIERKGDEGFGEGNFQALFESIEADQIRRGVISA